MAAILGRGRRGRSRRRPTYAPTSNTASHDNHGITIWVWGSACRAFGPLELC